MKWNVIDSLHLIEEYSKHDVLWNPRHCDYCNQKEKVDAWNSIAIACNVKTEEVKKKIANSLEVFWKKKGNFLFLVDWDNNDRIILEEPEINNVQLPDIIENSQIPERRDEASVVFAQYVVKKLNQFQGKTKILIENEIHKVLFNAEMELYPASTFNPKITSV